MDQKIEEPKEFDLKTHHRNKKTGVVEKVTPYIMKVSRDHGTRFFRGGVEFYPNGEPVASTEVSISTKDIVKAKGIEIMGSPQPKMMTAEEWAAGQPKEEVKAPVMETPLAEIIKEEMKKPNKGK